MSRLIRYEIPYHAQLFNDLYLARYPQRTTGVPTIAGISAFVPIYIFALRLSATDEVVLSITTYFSTFSCDEDELIVTEAHAKKLLFVLRVPTHRERTDFLFVAEEDMTVYKKTYSQRNPSVGWITVLLIPKGTTFHFDAGDKKCRAEKAIVLANESLFGSRTYKSPACAMRDKTFLYTVGETVTPRTLFEFSHETCASGIHFFFDRHTAVLY